MGRRIRKKGKRREKEEGDLRSKRERIGSFLYISMPLIDVRTVKEGWR